MATRSATRCAIGARTADVFVAVRPSGSAQEPEQLVVSVPFEIGRHRFLIPQKRPYLTHSTMSRSPGTAAGKRRAR
jgi:hypothetical protein